MIKILTGDGTNLEVSLQHFSTPVNGITQTRREPLHHGRTPDILFVGKTNIIATTVITWGIIKNII